MHGVDKKEAARQAKNEYQREWRSKNREKVRQYNQNYWEKKALQSEEK